MNYGASREEMADTPEHHRQRSEFIRRLVQRSAGRIPVKPQFMQSRPRSIVQFWHDLRELPTDVEECIASWGRWTTSGFAHRLFDRRSAEAFICGSLGARHERAFQRCYHPAMQADYFRLCYLLVEGGFYVDADDVCVGTDIGWLFEDGSPSFSARPGRVFPRPRSGALRRAALRVYRSAERRTPSPTMGC